jgi:hypothetical protein
MNEGTRSGKSTISLLGISAERPTNGLYLLPYLCLQRKRTENARINVILLRVHVTIFAVGTTMHSACVVELHIIVNHIKIIRIAQQYNYSKFMPPSTFKSRKVFL